LPPIPGAKTIHDSFFEIVGGRAAHDFEIKQISKKGAKKL
jgi:hypothetical protein